jgi:hypothetical protein
VASDWPSHCDSQSETPCQINEKINQITTEVFEPLNLPSKISRLMPPASVTHALPVPVGGVCPLGTAHAISSPDVIASTRPRRARPPRRQLHCTPSLSFQQEQDSRKSSPFLHGPSWNWNLVSKMSMLDAWDGDDGASDSRWISEDEQADYPLYPSHPSWDTSEYEGSTTSASSTQFAESSLGNQGESVQAVLPEVATARAAVVRPRVLRKPRRNRALLDLLLLFDRQKLPSIQLHDLFQAVLPSVRTQRYATELEFFRAFTTKILGVAVTRCSSVGRRKKDVVRFLDYNAEAIGAHLQLPLVQGDTLRLLGLLLAKRPDDFQRQPGYDDIPVKITRALKASALSS